MTQESDCGFCFLIRMLNEFLVNKLIYIGDENEANKAVAFYHQFFLSNSHFNADLICTKLNREGKLFDLFMDFSLF